MDPYGKSKVISAGYGSIRLNPNNSGSDYYMYMSLVTIKNWHCDLGIPVVVSKPVYDAFLKCSHNGGAAWVEELKGILYLNTDIPFKSLIPHAIGSSFSNEQEEL